jgi:CheY-like chemotaxis protein
MFDPLTQELETLQNTRVLVVDDNAAIHDDFQKILPCEPEEADVFDDLEKGLFGDLEDDLELDAGDSQLYDLSHAYQGEEALELVRKSLDNNRPFSLCFMDVRMPPGWDGIETIKRIWEVDPKLEMVICTAYSDYSWEKILNELGTTEHLMFLRKPFDVVSVKQMTLALVRKWNRQRLWENQYTSLQQAHEKLSQELASLKK